MPLSYNIPLHKFLQSHLDYLHKDKEKNQMSELTHLLNTYNDNYKHPLSYLIAAYYRSIKPFPIFFQEDSEHYILVGRDYNYEFLERKKIEFKENDIIKLWGEINNKKKLINVNEL